MSKKEVLPEGSVAVESVRNLEGFDPYASIPEIATWRDFSAEPIAEVEAPKPRRAVRAENAEG